MFGFLETGFQFFTWGNAVMLIIGSVLIYLAIGKKMEPLLLLPIGFAVILVNLPVGGLMDYEHEIKAKQPGIISHIVLSEGAVFSKDAAIAQTDGEAVSAPVFGRVKKIRVKEGQHVEAGDVIAVVVT